MPYSVTNKIQTIIPMKPLSKAKSRLKGNVDSISRRAAILMMLNRVIKAVNQNAKTNCVILGGDTLIHKLAKSHSVQWVPEKPSNNSLNDSLWEAMISAYTLGAEATLFLPGDLPLINTSDIHEIFLASESLKNTVLAKATKDGGTNALLQPAEHAFKPMLGCLSFSKHRKWVLDKSIPFSVIDTPGLQFDLDNDSDYEWALQNVKGFKSEITHWMKWILKTST